jgi:hypothetical protein
MGDMAVGQGMKTVKAEHVTKEKVSGTGRSGRVGETEIAV